MIKYETIVIEEKDGRHFSKFIEVRSITEPNVQIAFGGKDGTVDEAIAHFNALGYRIAGITHVGGLKYYMDKEVSS